MDHKLNINEIIDRIKLCFGIHGDSDLSKYLGKSTSYIAQCRQRQSIDFDMILDMLYEYSFDWLLTGKTRPGAKTIYKTGNYTVASSLTITDSTDEDRQMIDMQKKQLEEKNQMITELNDKMFKLQQLLAKYQLKDEGKD